MLLPIVPQNCVITIDSTEIVWKCASATCHLVLLPESHQWRPSHCRSNCSFANRSRFRKFISPLPFE
ncbi:unnamed protein product [Linum tenue]|uniref:Uncharacterized protein n=1 Tax=Linum tenue TaxID=586396 RepID=A0AAV0KID4_9ROSI|nr:unnamed protein product [Linum tenue]